MKGLSIQCFSVQNYLKIISKTVAANLALCERECSLINWPYDGEDDVIILYYTTLQQILCVHTTLQPTVE